MRRLQFTASATRDLRRLRDFIAEHDPAAAARVGQRLGRTIRLLRDQPALGRAVDALPGVRELAVGNYVLRYAATDAEIIVLRVWHGRESR